VSILDWTPAGVVLVDAGAVVLVDPGSADQVPPPDELGELLAAGEGVATIPGQHVPAVGVVVASGWGDGRYPVEVQRDSDGRIRAVRVTFIPHPVLGEGDEVRAWLADEGASS
jgi:hypothetical protein